MQMLLARTFIPLKVQVMPTLHPHYTHWLEFVVLYPDYAHSYDEVQLLKWNLGICRAAVMGMKRSCCLFGCQLMTIFFCWQTTPDSILALLLGSDILANSIRSLFACLISQRDTMLSSHNNDPSLPYQLENKKFQPLSNAIAASTPTSTAVDNHHPMGGITQAYLALLMSYEFLPKASIHTFHIKKCISTIQLTLPAAP